MKKFFILILVQSAAVLAAADLPGVPRDSNFNNTSGYDSTRIQAQLLVNVKDGADTVHFIRDNNDPRVITKTYIIKNIDAYEIRDYLRQMVQAKRVGNTSMEQAYPGNTSDPNIGTASSVELTTPANAQMSYNPALQLGSNTAVECLKYVDGTGLLMVSAEDYRFEDHKNGMGIDSLVEFLDRPGMGANMGLQTFFYIPRYVPARNLMPMIENVGMNISDVTELWQGQDAVAYDPDLNWLIFDVTNYSMLNIENMLEEYDRPLPQATLKIKIYELYDENDSRMGVDFQAWKNNDGADLFSAGGRFRDNWSALYGGTIGQTGSERTLFYNFNPKWNTRYLDLLASKGYAKVFHSGEITILNNTPAVLEKSTQVFYVDTTAMADDASDVPDLGVNAYKLLSAIIFEEWNPSEDIPVAKDNKAQATLSQEGFGFKMEISNASVNTDETNFTISISNTSLIGFESTGAPRISQSSTTTQNISLPHNGNSFIIGGIKKQELVKADNGIPWLARIPVAGYLFGSKGDSVKDSELVIVGECIPAYPELNRQTKGKSRSYSI